LAKRSKGGTEGRRLSRDLSKIRQLLKGPQDPLQTERSDGLLSKESQKNSKYIRICLCNIISRIDRHHERLDKLLAVSFKDEKDAFGNSGKFICISARMIKYESRGGPSDLYRQKKICL
jgi:hypothetical protein